MNATYAQQRSLPPTRRTRRIDATGRHRSQLDRSPAREATNRRRCAAAASHKHADSSAAPSGAGSQAMPINGKQCIRRSPAPPRVERQAVSGDISRSSYSEGRHD